MYYTWVSLSLSICPNLGWHTIYRVVKMIVPHVSHWFPFPWLGLKCKVSVLLASQSLYYMIPFLVTYEVGADWSYYSTILTVVKLAQWYGNHSFNKRYSPVVNFLFMVNFMVSSKACVILTHLFTNYTIVYLARERIPSFYEDHLN